MAAQQVGQRNQDDTQDGDRHPRGGVIVPEQPIGERGGVKEKRAMHQRGMTEPLPIVQFPSVASVQTLIVALHPRPQVHKAADDGDSNKEKIQCQLPVDTP